jgi:hypothetical protein
VAFLNNLDHDLIKLTGGADKPIAVDVHSDVNSGQALVEALKHPAEAKHGAERGARFQVAEFKAPLAQRITDEEWQKKLEAKKQ